MNHTFTTRSTRRRLARSVAAVAVLVVIGVPGPAGSAGAGGSPSMPQALAAVTRAGDVVLIDPSTGDVTHEIFTSSEPQSPEDSGHFAYSVERASNGDVYYETGPEPAVGEIWRYVPSTGQSRRVAYGRAPSLSRDNRYLAVGLATQSVAVYEASTGRFVREYPHRRGDSWVSDLSWNGNDALVAEFHSGVGPRHAGLGVLSLVSGEWNYPTQGLFGQPPQLFDPSFRASDRVVALRNAAAAFVPYGEPFGRMVVDVDVAGRSERVLLRGRFVDVSTSNGGQWVVAAKSERGFRIVAPGGDVTDRSVGWRLVDVDW